MALHTAVPRAQPPLETFQRILKTSHRYLNVPRTQSAIALSRDWVDPPPYRWR
jgi:hypothetical protein